MDKILSILQSGCNERIFLRSDGFLKYGIPLIGYDHINRGSCTCSPADNESVESIEKALFEIKNAPNPRVLVDQRTEKLRALLNVEGLTNDYQIFYAPSGTDLSYYPGLFIKVLFPGRPILNIIACGDEVGGGTSISAEGIYHGDFNQFDEEVPRGSKVSGGTKIKVHEIDIRGQFGDVQNNNADIELLLDGFGDENAIVVNLAYCTKSGLETSLAILDSHIADRVIWNVDMCQFRHDKKVIQHLLAKDAMVMLTGSKFFQSPPFSGMMLVPNKLMEKLNAANWSTVKMYKSIFSKYDLPSHLHDRVDFNPQFNQGLHCRLQCALDEMERYEHIDQDKANEKMSLWFDTMCKYIENSNNFELMPGIDMNNKTIIPFRVFLNGHYLNFDELKKWHFHTVIQSYKQEYGVENIFFGQPVKFDQNKGYVRLAIGSKNVRKFVQEDVKLFEEDIMIMNILESQLHAVYAEILRR